MCLLRIDRRITLNKGDPVCDAKFTCAISRGIQKHAADVDTCATDAVFLYPTTDHFCFAAGEIKQSGVLVKPADFAQ